MGRGPRTRNGPAHPALPRTARSSPARRRCRAGFRLNPAGIEVGARRLGPGPGDERIVGAQPVAGPPVVDLDVAACCLVMYVHPPSYMLSCVIPVLSCMIAIPACAFWGIIARCNAGGERREEDGCGPEVEVLRGIDHCDAPENRGSGKRLTIEGPRGCDQRCLLDVAPSHRVPLRPGGRRRRSGPRWKQAEFRNSVVTQQGVRPGVREEPLSGEHIRAAAHSRHRRRHIGARGRVGARSPSGPVRLPAVRGPGPDRRERGHRRHAPGRRQLHSLRHLRHRMHPVGLPTHSCC